MILKKPSENIKLWNNMCDTTSHMKFKTDTYAEKKGQEEYITKSYQWLFLRGKWVWGSGQEEPFLRKRQFQIYCKLLCELNFYKDNILFTLLHDK